MGKRDTCMAIFYKLKDRSGPPRQLDFHKLSWTGKHTEGDHAADGETESMKTQHKFPEKIEFAPQQVSHILS